MVMNACSIFSSLSPCIRNEKHLLASVCVGGGGGGRVCECAYTLSSARRAFSKYARRYMCVYVYVNA